MEKKIRGQKDRLNIQIKRKINIEICNKLDKLFYIYVSYKQIRIFLLGESNAERLICREIVKKRKKVNEK